MNRSTLLVHRSSLLPVSLILTSHYCEANIFSYPSDNQCFSAFEQEATPIEPLLHGNTHDLYAIIPSPARPQTIVEDSSAAFLAVNYPEDLMSPIIEPMKTRIQDLSTNLEEAKAKRAADVKHERSQKKVAKEALLVEKEGRQIDMDRVASLIRQAVQEERERTDKIVQKERESMGAKMKVLEEECESMGANMKVLVEEGNEAKEKLTALESAVLYQVCRSNPWFYLSLIPFNRTSSLCESFSFARFWMIFRAALPSISIPTSKEIFRCIGGTS